MSDKLPQLKASEIAKVLEKLGFEFKRQHGSHMVFKHTDGRTVTVPSHPTKFVNRYLLGKIIKRELQISREEFLKYL